MNCSSIHIDISVIPYNYSRCSIVCQLLFPLFFVVCTLLCCRISSLKPARRSHSILLVHHYHPPVLYTSLTIRVRCTTTHHQPLPAAVGVVHRVFGWLLPLHGTACEQLVGCELSAVIVRLVSGRLAAVLGLGCMAGCDEICGGVVVDCDAEVMAAARNTVNRTDRQTDRQTGMR